MLVSRARKTAGLAAVGAAILGVAALAACNGSNGSSPGIVSVPCTLPSGAQYALAYPANGATGVSDATSEVVVAGSSPLPASWQVLLLYSNGTVVAEGNVAAIAPSAIPTPYATPGFSSPEYQSAALTGPLTAASTVSVVLGNQALYCNGFPQVGSFTTQ